MKKMMTISLIVIVFLSGCTPALSPDIDAFEFSERCPHICWLGIQQGITTEEDALEILGSANRIEAAPFLASEEQPTTLRWYTTRKSDEYKAYVKIWFTEGHVQKISWMILYPFSVGDFINLLGEPDTISFDVVDAPDAYFTTYELYYASLDLVISANPIGHVTGPAAGDRVEGMDLGSGYIPPAHQPWLGYGHLTDYLPDMIIPAGEITPNP
jgi:hypothetical protein